jgi:trehalose 6-phosphate synthase
VSRLVVVSNRIASPREVRPGGLAVAMQAALKESGGLWFGWSGKIDNHAEPVLHSETAGAVEYLGMGLSRADHDDYYAGFANRTLWPLFHFRPGLVDFRRRTYEGYLRVNALFADRLATRLRDDDVIWVHDYHLLPLGSLLRERGVRTSCGFFLHTPLPPQELLTMLPVHRELFSTLSAYDLVGFHTGRYVRCFRDYACDELDAEINERGVYSVEGGRHSFRVGAFPIGIDTAQVASDARQASTHSAARRLRLSLEQRVLVIGVDRLDYSKGLPERFRAFALFLAGYPDWHRRVTLLQIAPSSRGEVREYRQVRRELEGIAGAINGRYAEPDWVPLRYVNKAYQQATLAGFYRLAKVGMVTPFRDGMNLVAKEYVAAQDPDDPGVLMLSRFAGAAEELDAALLVNPFDGEGMASALHAALVMPLAERKARWRSMMDVLEKQDVTAWRRSFLEALTGQFDAPARPELATLPGLDLPAPPPGAGRRAPDRRLH